MRPSPEALRTNPGLATIKARLAGCRFPEQSWRGCQQIVQKLYGIGAIVFLTGAFTGWSATYYVAKTGSDANPGTSGSPWLTVAKAQTNVVAGDTVKFGAGEWYELLNTAVAGNATNRITWDGQNLAQLSRVVTFDQPYNTLQNFDVSGTNRAAWYWITLKLGAHYSIVSNCYIHVPKGVGTNGPAVVSFGGVSCEGGTTKPFDDNEASNCQVVNNYFNLLSGEFAAFEMKGSNNLFQANICTNFYQGNEIFLFGRYHRVIGNLFHNTAQGENYGSHPDWVQYFGMGGDGSIGHVLDGNIVSETSATAQMTRANGPSQDPLLADGTNGVYHGNWTFKNNIFLNQKQIASAAIPNIKWYNNLFYRCNYVSGHAISAATGANGSGEGVVILNNMFIDCGPVGSSNQCWYSIGGADGPTLANWTADYNYVGKNNWGPAQTAASPTGYRFKEAHMVNGGDPKIAFLGTSNTMNFRLQYNSPLIDAGTNLSAVLNTIDGMLRPLGAKTDIGPYEFDTNLLMHLDFNNPQTNHVADVTGRGHHAWQMDATNWITLQNGYGLWRKVGIINNNGADYDLSQYGAITNISGGLEFITNGTIVVRVAWGSDCVRWDTIMDSGDLVAYTPNPATATNAWALSWGWPSLSVASDQPTSGAILRKWPILNYTDTNTVVAYWNGHPHDGTWHHIAVSWNAGSDRVISYFNGTPFATNALNAPYLRVAAPRSWICLGANQHSGTPAWDTPTDKFPNSGFFKGKMDDVRIYNRVLSTSEIENLYRRTATASGSYPSVPSGPSGKPAAPGNLYIALP